mgnify:CR=1 FL=1
MSTNCNCNNGIYNPYIHRLVSATAGTTLVLNVTDSTNIGEREFFDFTANAKISDLISGAPLPVEITINGANVPLWNCIGEQIQSNEIPPRANGFYTTGGTTPHVIFFTTPRINRYIR